MDLFFKYRTDFNNLIIASGTTELEVGFNEKLLYTATTISLVPPIYNYKYDGITIIEADYKTINHYMTVKKIMQDLQYFNVQSGSTDYYLIYDYMKFDYPVSNKIAPVNVDYDLGGLYKKRTFDKGELIQVEYYGKYNNGSGLYNDLVVKEERTYYRVNRMLNRREMKISWYLNDGETVGEIKNTTKYYTLQEAIEAGVTRRNNIITKLKIEVIGILQMASGITSIQAQNLGQVFLDVYYSEIGKFITGFEDVLKYSIANDIDFVWLSLVIPNTGGITIRQYLISELTIDYTKNNIDI